MFWYVIFCEFLLLLTTFERVNLSWSSTVQCGYSKLIMNTNM